MYRVLLVDDDTIARVKLKNLVQWEQLNCQIVAEASGGREAIAKTEQFNPQILITDIDMPGMNGVDLIHYTRERYPDMYILALSAYDDFDYVRDSLRYGASDYILKHQMTSRRLETVLQEAFDHLKDYPADHPFFPEKGKNLISSLLAGDDRRQETVSFLEKLMPDSNLLLAYGRFEREITKQEEMRFRYLEGIVSDTLSLYDWKVFWEFYGNGLVVLFLAESHVLHKDIEEVLDQVSENVRRYTGISLEFKMSGFYEDIRETARVWDSLRQKCSTRKRPEAAAQELILRIGEMQELERLLREGDMEKIRQCLAGLFLRFQNNDWTSVQISIVAVELCNTLQRVLQGYARSGEIPSGEADRILDEAKRMLKHIQSETHIDTIQRLILVMYGDFIRNVQAARKPCFSNHLVNETVAYVRCHCGDPISLRDVADALNVNSAYLSRLFKKHTGKTIVTYINEQKMERAKQMIGEGTLSCKEVSEALGFQNYNYFHRLFKEIYGFSPSDL